MMIDSAKLENVFDGLIKHLTSGPTAFDWRLVKAMMKQESAFNPIATSSVGARGLLQAMPATDQWLDNESDGYDVYGNVKDGIDFLGRLYAQWIQKGIIGEEADKFVVASYNAGPGNILKAQKIAVQQGLDPNLWKSIAEVLVNVTGKHSEETINYVERVIGNYNTYKGGA